MKNLLNSVITNVSLADFVECGIYTATANCLVSPTINLTNLSGLSGNYTARITIDDIILVPERSLYVNDATTLRMSGRGINLSKDSTLKLSIKGNINDVNATIITDLYNITPVDTQEFVDISIPQITQAIEEYLPTATIVVNSTRTILAPETQVIKQTPASKPQAIKQIPPVLNRR